MDDLPPSRWPLALSGLFLLLQAAFVASEVAFLATGAVRVRRLEQDGAGGARILGWLASDRSRLLTTVLVCITALAYGAESLVTLVASHIDPVYGHYVGLAAVLLISVLFVEALPVLVAAKAPERVAVVLAPIVLVAYWVLWPVVTVVSGLSGGFLRLVGAVRKASPSMTEAEVISLIEVAEVEDDEKSMLRRVLDFGDRTVEEVMVPRTDMVAVEAEATIEQVAALMVERGHSRLPVYRDRRDTIVGIAYSKDLLPPLADGRRGEAVESVMRSPVFVHEKTGVQRLVDEFRRQRRGMALVADEFGGIAGLVTLEDALEELVGEIQDEHDREEAAIREVAPNRFALAGSAKLHDVMRDLVIELPEGEYETVSGLIASHLGRLSRAGDVLTLDNGVRLEVLEVAARRVRAALLVRPETADMTDEPGGEGPR